MKKAFFIIAIPHFSAALRAAVTDEHLENKERGGKDGLDYDAEGPLMSALSGDESKQNPGVSVEAGVDENAETTTTGDSAPGSKVADISDHTPSSIEDAKSALDEAKKAWRDEEDEDRKAKLLTTLKEAQTKYSELKKKDPRKVKVPRAVKHPEPTLEELKAQMSEAEAVVASAEDVQAGLYADNPEDPRIHDAKRTRSRALRKLKKLQKRILAKEVAAQGAANGKATSEHAMAASGEAQKAMEDLSKGDAVEAMKDAKKAVKDLEAAENVAKNVISDATAVAVAQDEVAAADAAENQRVEGAARAEREAKEAASAQLAEKEQEAAAQAEEARRKAEALAAEEARIAAAEAQVENQAVALLAKTAVSDAGEAKSLCYAKTKKLLKQLIEANNAHGISPLTDAPEWLTTRHSECVKRRARTQLEVPDTTSVEGRTQILSDQQELLKDEIERSYFELARIEIEKVLKHLSSIEKSEGDVSPAIKSLPTVISSYLPGFDKLVEAVRVGNLEDQALEQLTNAVKVQRDIIYSELEELRIDPLYFQQKVKIIKAVNDDRKRSARITNYRTLGLADWDRLDRRPKECTSSLLVTFDPNCYEVMTRGDMVDGYNAQHPSEKLAYTEWWKVMRVKNSNGESVFGLAAEHTEQYQSWFCEKMKLGTEEVKADTEKCSEAFYSRKPTHDFKCFQSGDGEVCYKGMEEKDKAKAVGQYNTNAKTKVQKFSELARVERVDGEDDYFRIASKNNNAGRWLRQTIRNKRFTPNPDAPADATPSPFLRWIGTLSPNLANKHAPVDAEGAASVEVVAADAEGAPVEVAAVDADGAAPAKQGAS